MNTHELSEQVSELRWLVYELGKEMEALAISEHPEVHHFLLRSLAKRLTKRASVLAEHPGSPLTTPVARPIVPSYEHTA